jgi:hypothetical protein
MTSASHPSLALSASTFQYVNKVHHLAPTIGPPPERTSVCQDPFLERQEMEPILISPSVEDGFRSSIDQRNLHNDAGDDENADEDGCVGSSHVSPLPNLMSIKRLRV